MTIDTNRISGRISLSKDKILVLAFPCIEGWTAYVDGEKTDIIRTNYRHMGLVIPEGEHSFE
ncbi:MAG: YfhO family protein, partial [Lachnospiraceae bacterium]|nr:YfhO family protein [Lachnospiraceae bacterium]